MPLLERAHDLAELTERWDQAQQGGGGMVLVRGEAGAGKTSLVQSFTEGATGAPRVLWGGCDPMATPRPLGPLRDVADELAEGCRALLQEATNAHEIFAAVYAELRDHPTILVIDDLHWADQGTVDLLRFLVRRLPTTRSLVVGALRPADVATAHPLRLLLGDAARSPQAHSITLKPLSPPAIHTLVGDRAVDADHLHAVTGGNPFFVTEMLAHEGEDLPASVRDAVLARTADLDGEARALLDLLVSAPEAIPDRLLPLLGIGLPALRAVDQAGLIAHGQRGVTFRHDIVRLVVADTLPPGGEPALHRQMLAALEGSRETVLTDPAVLAHHARGAQDSRAILAHASAAGSAATRSGAHTQATEFFQLALDWGVPAPAEKAALLESLAHEQYLLDQLDNAIASSRGALQLREAQGAAAKLSADHRALATYEWSRGNRREAELHAATAVDVVAESDERGLLASALALQAYLAAQASDLPKARALTEQVRQLAAELGTQVLDDRVGMLDGLLALTAGDPAGRGPVLDILEAAPQRFDDVYSSGYSNLAYLDIEHRRLAEAAAVLDRSLPLTVEYNIPICHVWQLGSRGRLHFLQGDWTAAELDSGAVLQGPSAPLARTWPLLIRGLLRLRREGGDGRELDDAWQIATGLVEPLRLLPAATALVERAWLLGEPDARTTEAIELLERYHLPGLEWVRGDLAVWLHRLSPDLPLDAAGLPDPHRLQLKGHHVAAAQEWERIGTPYDRALALVESGIPNEVRVGLDLLDHMGAEAVAAKARRDLRARGVLDVPSRRRGTTRTNPAGLTVREVEVLSLLDAGLTNAELANRLYISPKTADHHVTAILAKLRVANRREAARAGRELGLIS